MPGVQRRQTEPFRELGKRHRPEAACGVGAHLGGGDLGIEQPRHLARDDATRVRARPLVVVPVVGRAHDRERELGIRHPELVALPGEAGERRREVERRVHAVEVHVVHAGVDVPRAASHLVEARRLEAQLLARTADDGVEPDLVVAFAVVGPVLHAVVVDLDARRRGLEARREPALEQVRRLDEVVVDRDERAPPGPAFGLGQERHPFRLAGDEEAGPPFEVVEPDGHAPMLRGESPREVRPTAGRQPVADLQALGEARGS